MWNVIALENKQQGPSLLQRNNDSAGRSIKQFITNIILKSKYRVPYD